MQKTMKRTHLIAALLLWPLFLCAQSAIDYTQYVNPFIGTQTDETGALSGSTFPGATMPQGMVQLSPETEQMVTWDPCSGYDYNKDIIYGFTHTHLSGTGCTDLIDVSLMPSRLPRARASIAILSPRASRRALSSISTE